MRKVTIKPPARPVRREGVSDDKVRAVNNALMLYALFFVAMLFIFGLCKQYQQQGTKNEKTEFVKPQNSLK